MSLPYLDLAASQARLEPNTQRERAAWAVRLGWDGVALAHQAPAKLTEAADRCSFRPVEPAALLAAATGVREALAAAEQRHSERGRRHGDPYAFRQLSRVNIPADDPAAAQAACASPLARGYDLVAVQPSTERCFQLACASLDCDLVALDLSRRLSWRFKPAHVKAALARGLHFEICFAPALRDPAARRQLFANATALARETRGRGLVLSSGARSYMELRGPLDAVNLGTLLGLTPQQAAAAVTSAPAAVVQRAAAQRAYRGTLTLRVRSAEEAAAVRQAAADEEARLRAAAGGASGGVQPMAVDGAGPQQQQQQPRSFAQAAGRS